MFRLERVSSGQSLPDEETRVDISKQFDGAKHTNWKAQVSYTNPGPYDLEGQETTSKLYRHRDILNRVTWKPKDTLRYISPTYGKPYRMVVQATPTVLQDKTGEWRRTKIHGSGPIALRLSSWILKELLRSDGHLSAIEIAFVVGKVLLASPLLMCLILVPMGDSSARDAVYYKAPPHRTWDYPVHARNQLDSRPSLNNPIRRGVRLNELEENLRLLKPKTLCVRSNTHGWQIQNNHKNMRYIFISYTREHFGERNAIGTLKDLHRIAQYLTEEAGLDAYWLDVLIDQTDSQTMTEDVYRISDVVRSAQEVCVAVPDLRSKTLEVWGKRLWTLPEVILANNEDMTFCTPGLRVEKISRIALAYQVWGRDQAGRILIENNKGDSPLGRLEHIQVALQALLSREFNEYSTCDPAYALMGLLSKRIKPQVGDNLFQALARLSLANDSDRIVERMICMLPPPPTSVSYHPRDTNLQFNLNDDFGSNLWDIEPICQVAGVGEGKSIILDGCRGASIRWKDIPAIAFANRASFKRKTIAYTIRSPALWVLIGMGMVAGSGATRAAGAVFLVIGLLLMLGTPWSVLSLYGGKVWGATPWLIGFEGTLPIDEIESLTFGNAIGRLKYAPSSTLFSCRKPDERLGVEPPWLNRGMPDYGLPVGHRLFTLIDTGTMSVSIFSAEKPPSVALIAGREGGMLRVLLCSYDSATGTLFKESVIRMETPMEDQAALLGWVKVA